MSVKKKDIINKEEKLGGISFNLDNIWTKEQVENFNKVLMKSAEQQQKCNRQPKLITSYDREGILVACNDGSMWFKQDQWNPWERLEDIPVDE